MTDEKRGHNSTNLQSDLSSVKLEPYSDNTLMTIDRDNSDSRLIRFKEGFSFEEAYQEWRPKLDEEERLCGALLVQLLQAALLLGKLVLDLAHVDRLQKSSSEVKG